MIYYRVSHSISFFGQIFVLLIFAVSNTLWAAEGEAVDQQYRTSVLPFVTKYCSACHQGDDAESGLSFDRYTKSAHIQTDLEVWEKIHRVISDRQMPPQDELQPGEEELTAILLAVRQQLDSFDCTAERHPGRVTLRRLNKAEYNNTIRDLTGLEINPAADFPSDDVGAGFDNIGDVLTIPPVLLEKYLAAAQSVAEQIVTNDEVRKRVFPYEPASPDQIVETARRNVREFAERAFRRPITPDENERLFVVMKAAWEQDSSPAEIMQTVTAAVLSSPHFLFRVEQDPAESDADGIRELDSFEVASRLSYFLWSTMPDEELFQLARQGELTKPDVLRAQARRMLSDDKAHALVDNFAGQWLQLRDIPRLQPDPELFPDFDAQLKVAMRRETELFFQNMIREDRSVLEFLTAEYSFLNERLARHYGIPDVHGSEFRKVNYTNGERRGVLTHAGILMLTSNPTRTSPVKRGKWILDNILAEPPPPPPPNVPELEEGTETLGSLREQMEQHRSNPACAVCHLKMDALGFGMENFDAVGAWRVNDGRFDIDSSGSLPGGQQFHGASELMQILADRKSTEFCRCLSQKLLTYALGRALVSSDRCAVNRLVDELTLHDYRFGALVDAIV
ncbi:MAG: DUF1592 domain-containing protein, partial [Planctomycetaceae bacterium]|nr:DUF1592 domain-containing protein [Planctomycetaceae bacterium]